MANYDTPGVSYDSGIYYDGFVPAPPTPKTKMAKVKLDLKGKTDAEIIQIGNTVKTAMTGNANFTTPVPTLSTLATQLTTGTTNLTTAQNAQTTAKSATATKDSSITLIKQSLQSLATYVELTSGGDATKIMSAGMSVQNAKTPTAVPAQVMNLAATAGDNAGEIDLQWDPVAGIKSYEIQSSPDPMTATSFVGQPSVTKSKAALLGFTSGARVWTRVRGVNSAGQGPWSDPATKIVP